MKRLGVYVGDLYPYLTGTTVQILGPSEFGLEVCIPDEEDGPSWADIPPEDIQAVDY